MRPKSCFFAVLLPALLAGCFPNAAKPPPGQAALVVLRVQEAPGGGTPLRRLNGLPVFSAEGVETSLVLTKFSPADNHTDRYAFNEVLLSVAAPMGPVNDIVVQPIQAGTYVISRFEQSRLFAECFNRETFSFDIGPGQVLYLGNLDAKFHTDRLARAATAAGRATVSGLDNFIVFDVAGAPHLRPARTGPDLQSLQAVVSQRYPAFTQPLAAAAFRPAVFEPINHAILRDVKACGGMMASG